MNESRDDTAGCDDASIVDLLLHGPDDGHDGLGDAPTAAWLARMEADPRLREALVEEAVLHAGLRRSFRRRALSAWALGRVEAASLRRRLPTVGVLGAIAACVAVVFLGSRPHATVTSGVGASAWREGVGLRGETCELKRGLLGLTTRSGARLVIEAPAAFRFESPQRLQMLRGRIAADVPPSARGFTVVTRSGEAVDLGTRFAVDVPVGGEPEVHVFEGEVVARGRTAAGGTSLRGGDACSLAGNAARELRTAAFIRGDEAKELAAGLTAGREAESRMELARVRRDPAIIAVIDFEDDDGVEAVTGGRYRIVQGRWPGSRAADFVRVGDHLPVDVGAGRDWPHLTLAAWVRLDAIGAPYQSLYHTDGWERDNPGQVHWMIAQPGVMRLALREMLVAPGAAIRQSYPDSRTSVLGAEGRWMHLAAVYDGPRKTVRFYLNGDVDGETRLAAAPPARLGPARIGNWSDKDRTLSGRIDDLVLLGRAVGDEEIRSLYASGDPYRKAGR